MRSKFRDAQTAYEDARQEQLRNDPALMKRLPPWEKLTPELREPIIHNVFAGWKAKP